MSVNMNVALRGTKFSITEDDRITVQRRSTHKQSSQIMITVRSILSRLFSSLYMSRLFVPSSRLMLPGNPVN